MVKNTLLDKLKAQLRKKHPDWDEDTISRHARDVAKMADSKEESAEGIKEEKKEIVVGENVKLFLDSDVMIAE